MPSRQRETAPPLLINLPGDIHTTFLPHGATSPLECLPHLSPYGARPPAPARDQLIVAATRRANNVNASWESGV
eukprot:11204553-Lingulodinium_polyedra.AAC.1